QPAYKFERRLQLFRTRIARDVNKTVVYTPHEGRSLCPCESCMCQCGKRRFTQRNRQVVGATVRPRPAGPRVQFPQMMRSNACLALAATVICTACGGHVDANALRSTLVGDFNLFARSRDADPRLESGDLTLTSDGRSRLRCKYKDGRLVDVSGTWEATDSPSVIISPFADCAGVLKIFQQNTGAELTEASGYCVEENR